MLIKIIALSTIIAAATPVLPVGASPEADLINSCIDNSEYRVVNEATVYQKHGNLLAVELDVTQRSVDYKALQVIEIVRGRCISRYSNSFDIYPLSTVFDTDTAKALRFGWERRRIESDRPREETQDWLFSGQVSLSPESHDAFVELGFDVTKTTICKESTLKDICY